MPNDIMIFQGKSDLCFRLSRRASLPRSRPESFLYSKHFPRSIRPVHNLSLSHQTTNFPPTPSIHPTSASHKISRNSSPLMHFRTVSVTQRVWGYTLLSNNPSVLVSLLPRASDHESPVTSHRPLVLLRHPAQSARITLVAANVATWETSPLPPVSKSRRADIGFGIRRLPYPVASRSRQFRDRTRKKAWLHRSKVEPTSRVARVPDRVGKAGSVRMGRRPILGPR